MDLGVARSKIPQHGLFCNPKKCEFHKDKIELLGVTVDEKGFGMEDKKVKDIRDWPTPKTLKELKGFIGFCNFYQGLSRDSH